jgi:vacuolar-type H+-ATPase subunit H
LTCQGDTTMVTAPEIFKQEVSETELLVEEFRQKIVVSLSREKEHIKDLAEREAKAILTKAYQDSASLTLKAQEESKQIINLAREQAARDTDALLAQVQIKAEQIVKNAEEITRKDAREKTRKEVDSILLTAHKEAENITSQALQQARNESKEIIEAAKREGILAAKQVRTDAERESRELILAASNMKQKATSELTESSKKAEESAQKIIEKAIQSAKEKAENESRNIIEQAQIRAQKERDLVIAASSEDAKRAADNEYNRILTKAKEEAEHIVSSARERVHIQLEESSKLMTEIQQKMLQIIDTTGLDISTVSSGSQTTVHFQSVSPKPDQVISLPKVTPNVIASDKRNPKQDNAQNKINSLFYDEEKRTYEGKLKIDIAPPVDREQLDNLSENLIHTSNLNVIQKGETEDGSAWIEIEISSPLPLIDILRKVPEVKDVVGCKSYIIIAFKSRQMV